METSTGSKASDFKLGNWWIRPQRNELEKGAESVRVEARSMGVLTCLARRAPKVVSKERLLAEVWSDAPFVGEEVISHAIWELRKALGDSAKDPTYIQTIARRGYRLLEEVAWPSGSPVPLEGARIDHYEIRREIGRGSMGVVYEAFDSRLERTVALKFLAPELTRDAKACRRFVREARLAASLDHPNLATVHEVGETSQGHRYLVTAYYAGGSLKDRLARGPIPLDEAISLARQLAAGLAAAHARDIVHRDIKPANLLLDEHGTLKIGDFGIAKLLGGTDLTSTGATLGTPAYKSPEQSRGESVDHRTDLWSFGVVFFEMLTGRRPFDGEYEHAVVHAILSRDPEPLENVHGEPVPAHARSIVARSMAKDPAARFDTAAEIVEALDGAEAGGEAGFGARSRSSALRRFAPFGLAVLALIAIAWFVVFGPQSGPSVSREARDHLAQGKAAWLEGNDEENLAFAQKHFTTAAELEPDWVEAFGHLAVLHADVYALNERPADRESAEEWMARIEAIEPESALLLVARARLLLFDGSDEDLEEAERLLRRALTIESDCPAGESCDLVYLWLAESLWRQEREKEALQFLDEGIGVGDGRVRCRLKRAQFNERRGAFDEAIADYKEVLEKWEPDQTTALNDLGVLYLGRGQWAEAGSLFRKLYLRTKDPAAKLNLGHSFYGRGMWKSAESHYREADRRYLELEIANPAPAMSLGDVFLEQGEVEEASIWYEEALARFDRMVEPSLNRQGQRAVCLAKLGRLEEAEQAISALLPKVAVEPRLWIYGARISALANDRDSLQERAQLAVKGGEPTTRLNDDAAFRDFRKDVEYQHWIESAVP